MSSGSIGEGIEMNIPDIYIGDVRDFFREYSGPKFDVILIDPPWHHTIDMLPLNRRVENHYHTMELDELMALPILNLANNPAELFLWTTNTFVPEACDLMRKWGFRYITKMDWVKMRNNRIQTGLGINVRGSSESILIGKYGDFPVPKPENRPSTVIFGERDKHSEKPEESYIAIEKMYPEARRLEIFGRRQRPGWFVTGNEIQGWIPLK